MAIRRKREGELDVGRLEPCGIHRGGNILQFNTCAVLSFLYQIRGYLSIIQYMIKLITL